MLKFNPPFRHAKFYFGYCKHGNFKHRFHQHMTGNGAKIIQRAIEAGIEIIPVLLTEGSLQDEHRYKKWNNNERVLKCLIRKGVIYNV